MGASTAVGGAMPIRAGGGGRAAAGAEDAALDSRDGVARNEENSCSDGVF